MYFKHHPLFIVFSIYLLTVMGGWHHYVFQLPHSALWAARLQDTNARKSISRKNQFARKRTKSAPDECKQQHTVNVHQRSSVRQDMHIVPDLRERAPFDCFQIPWLWINQLVYHWFFQITILNVKKHKHVWNLWCWKVKQLWLKTASELVNL